MPANNSKTLYKWGVAQTAIDRLFSFFTR